MTQIHGRFGREGPKLFFMVEMITDRHMDPGFEGCKKHVTNLYMGNGLVTRVKPVDMCS